MGFFSRFFSSKNRTREPTGPAAQAAPLPPASSQTPPELDLTLPVTEEERDLVSAITAAIFAGDRPDSAFRVTSVRAADVDKEVAVAIASAVAAADHPDSFFRLKSVRAL